MPYITAVAKHFLERSSPSNAGELNYAITKLLVEYWNAAPKTYQRINDIIGALEGAKLEFNRRVVVPYETQKLLENGDVF